MSTEQKNDVNWFRNSAPYINANRKRTFVLMIGGEAAKHQNFATIIHDIALLHSLGVRLVIVHGARPQIDQQLEAHGIKSKFYQDLRITTESDLQYVKEAIGVLRIDLEAKLSMGLKNSPMHGADLRVTGGNQVIAKPLGILEGVDLCHTGEVRRIDCDGIRQQLDNGAIVLLSPFGYSPTGEIFSLSAEDLATEAAISLRADKFILMCAEPGASDADGNLYRELDTQEAQRILAEGSNSPETTRHLRAASKACVGGVKRAHLVSYVEDGALLTELYTRDGVGTLITDLGYEQIRRAGIGDVGGIISLIQPFEQKGILVRRSRELLENEIGRFTVIERDGAIVGCAALYPFADENAGELACVAIDEKYRDNGRGDSLLQEVVRQAKALGMRRLIVLTTQTGHWFIERGFAKSSVEQLPDSKKSLYNWQRNSSVLELQI